VREKMAKMALREMLVPVAIKENKAPLVKMVSPELQERKEPLEILALLVSLVVLEVLVPLDPWDPQEKWDLLE